RILIVGNRGGTNIGECFERAAISFGLEVCLLESRRAMDAPSWLRRLNWHLRGHRPTKLGVFSEAVYQQCSAWRPDALLTTGLAPLHQRALERIRSLGILTLNYLTDDPWNRTHYASWFMNAVTQYDFVFSPRRANQNRTADRKSTRLNSSHVSTSYAVFCLKKKKQTTRRLLPRSAP